MVARPRLLRGVVPWVLAWACGCSPSADPGTDEAAAQAGVAADTLETPAAELALNEPVAIALAQLPRKFDPLDDLEPWAQRISDDLLFEGLVRRTGDRYPWVAPAISDACEVDRDYAVASITCHVPRGIRFHDGTELEVDDVIYSLTYWLDRRRAWMRERHGLLNFQGVEIVDGPRSGAAERDVGRWVRINLDKREPLALEALAVIKIVPRNAHRGQETRFAQHPIGTGPMRMSSLAQDRIVLERFADFHDPARAALASRLIVRAIADGSEALTALRRGEIHLLPEVSPIHVPVELGKPGMSGRFAAWLVTPPEYDFLLWNVGGGVQESLPLRRALHDALPLSAISREVYGAPGWPASAPIDLHDPSPIDLEALAGIKAGEPVRGGLLALPPMLDDAEGLTRAAAALDALEWKLEQGVRQKPGGWLRVTLTWDNASGRPTELTQRIKAAWEAIGVSVPEATAGWNYLLILLRAHDFKAALLHFGGHSDEDLHQLFHSRGASNFAGVVDEELDRALADYRGAPDRTARDASKQRVADRLAQLRVVSLLHAPSHVLLASRRLLELEFVDDAPRLDRLGLLAGDIEWGAERPNP